MGTNDRSANQKSITFHFCGSNNATAIQNAIFTLVLTNTGQTNPIALAFSAGSGAGYLFTQGNASGVKLINSSSTFTFTMRGSAAPPVCGWATPTPTPTPTQIMASPTVFSAATSAAFTTRAASASSFTKTKSKHV
ncbi:hypothetical protein HDU98_004572 [Podochytrium sp. JEL0797]|nr:hypothetical protein HDU98_004572 [Podochytrium sp. JEL0797]